MSRWDQIISIVFSLLIAIGSILMILMLLSDYVMSAMIAFSLNLQKDANWRIALVVIGIVIFILATLSFLLAMMNARLHKARIRSNELGTIDIGVKAIESIALDATKSAQSGVKTAKARVSPSRGDTIRVSLFLTTYPGVEIPAMMNKVQERVKKDIERYTGIEVVDVPIKVSDVVLVSSHINR